MVQKILNNEILNTYKLNRCIPKSINNKNLKGGDTILSNLLSFNQILFIIHMMILLLIIFYQLYKKINIKYILFTSVIGFLIVILYYYFKIHLNNDIENTDKKSIKNRILSIILGENKKITQVHSIIFFSVSVFIIFIIINIGAILLVKLIDGNNNKCLKYLNLDRLTSLNILPDNSLDTKNLLDNEGQQQNPEITVNKDYFDLINFIKPPIIEKENTVAQEAGIIFNPANPGIPGNVVNPNVPSNNNASLINIGTNNNNQGSIFDNRIKVVEKDIYKENDFFKFNSKELKNKLKKYFQYVYDNTNKSHYIIFKLKQSDIVNTPYGLLL